MTTLSKEFFAGFWATTVRKRFDLYGQLRGHGNAISLSLIGWSVYPGFIPDGDRIVSKTYMMRVEGENTRLPHYLARLYRLTLCYSRVRGNAQTLYWVATSLSQILGCSCSSLIHPFIQQRRNLDGLLPDMRNLLQIIAGKQLSPIQT